MAVLQPTQTAILSWLRNLPRMEVELINNAWDAIMTAGDSSERAGALLYLTELVTHNNRLTVTIGSSLDALLALPGETAITMRVQQTAIDINYLLEPPELTLRVGE